MRDLPEWLEEFAELFWTKECQHHGTHPQALLVKQIRNFQENWYRASTVLLLTSLNDIAKYARGQRLQGLRAENAMAEPYLLQKILVFLITADHKVLSEGCESRNNHKYAVAVQDLATQFIQSYPCKNENFSGDGKEFTKVCRAVGKAKSHLHRRFFGISQIL